MRRAYAERIHIAISAAHPLDALTVDEAETKADHLVPVGSHQIQVRTPLRRVQPGWPVLPGDRSVLPIFGEGLVEGAEGRGVIAPLDVGAHFDSGRNGWEGRLASAS